MDEFTQTRSVTSFPNEENVEENCPRCDEPAGVPCCDHGVTMWQGREGY